MHQQSGQATAADIVADGHFKLVALQGKNHVAVGCHTSGSADFSLRGLPGRLPGKCLIPNRYAEAATSGLTFEVEPGDNKADFALTD